MFIDVVFHMTIGLLAALISLACRRLCPHRRHQIAAALMLLVVEAYLSVQLVG